MKSDLAELIEVGRKIVTKGAELQDTTGLTDSFPLEERKALAEQLSEEYHSWYAKTQAVLPESDCKELTKLYEGSFFRPGIKAFFTKPLEINPLHNEQTESLVPMWLHPYAESFKSRVIQQVTIIERHAYNRPAVLKLGSGEVHTYLGTISPSRIFLASTLLIRMFS